jgi:hypothetical protein
MDRSIPTMDLVLVLTLQPISNLCEDEREAGRIERGGGEGKRTDARLTAHDISFLWYFFFHFFSI